jgi:2-octaprenyl-6-methoxyphenol hydroxylase
MTGQDKPGDAITEVVVVGGGAAGLTAAIALAEAGIATSLVAGAPRPPDNRTTALLAGSVTALDTLGVWPVCREHAAPLRTMRLIDDTPRLLRAPEVHFDASEIGLDAFGSNIENRHLLAALTARARALPALTWIAENAVAVSADARAATVSLASGGSVVARLAVGAEGRHSLCRTAAGIATETARYPQIAITVNLSHTRPHRNVSTEFHTRAGPFTLVPLPGQRSSLVFVVDPSDAPGLTSLSDAALAMEIERRSHSILGKITVEPGRGAFPLTAETARSFSATRIVLIGESAHVMPPIGAQGLNLGLRDAATMAELVVAACRVGEDAGSAAVTGSYERMRRADVASRGLAVDLLNRSLLSDLLPFHGVRGLGLFMLRRFGPLRRAAMREGVMPAASQPRLMRGLAL